MLPPVVPRPVDRGVTVSGAHHECIREVCAFFVGIVVVLSTVMAFFAGLALAIVGSFLMSLVMPPSAVFRFVDLSVGVVVFLSMSLV